MKNRDEKSTPNQMKIEKNWRRDLTVGTMGFFVALSPIRADDPAASSLTNAPASTAPTVPTKSAASAVANPVANPSATPNSVPNSSTQAAEVMSIDDLLNVTVTSAGQKEQKLSDVAAAITVLSADDIQRSGATNIPDLLRYVPGVEVGQANNSDLSVAIRGFGGVFSSKLLVLIDGRSIYDPTFAGVDWGFQRMMMENIDRVEVIRGPGATIWGANAVDGVINIITKDAAETQGGFVSGLYGTKDQGTGEFRYGFQPVQGLSLRLFGQYDNVVANDALPADGPGYDALQNGLIGFRADYHPNDDDHFRLSSDASRTRLGDERVNAFTAIPAYTQTGDAENVNFVYEHNFESDNQLTVQSYYDRFARGTNPASQFNNAVIQTADVQIRHTLPLEILPIKQELIYGAEYRQVDNHMGETRGLAWLRDRDDQSVSLFAQTDLHPIDNVLTLTLGTKYDHNDYTGNEVQPSARLLWKIDGKNSLWCSVSRAVREPAVIETEATTPGIISGNPNLKSEELTAYEIGYRVEPASWLSVDIAAYYNDYNNLIQAYFPAHSFEVTYEQFQKAQTYGIEPSFTAQVQPWWKLSGSYSLLSFHTDNSGISPGNTPLGPHLDSIDPTNEFSLRSSFDLPDNIDIDVGGRYVDITAGANAYFAADVRVAWRPTPSWEVSIVGQNLLAGNHIENPNQFGNATYVSPEVYGKVVFKF
jgi:iron complex outermembrane receptor protein